MSATALTLQRDHQLIGVYALVRAE